MKNNKDIRGKDASFNHTDDLQKRSTKLDPIKKNGKEKRSIYQQLSLDDGEGEIDLNLLKRKESVLDYFDDEYESDYESDNEQWDGDNVVDEEAYDEDEEDGY